MLPLPPRYWSFLEGVSVIPALVNISVFQICTYFSNWFFFKLTHTPRAKNFSVGPKTRLKRYWGAWV